MTDDDDAKVVEAIEDAKSRGHEFHFAPDDVAQELASWDWGDDSKPVREINVAAGVIALRDTVGFGEVVLYGGGTVAFSAVDGYVTLSRPLQAIVMEHVNLLDENEDDDVAERRSLVKLLRDLAAQIEAGTARVPDPQ
jgi:hypothetical protein